MREIKFRAWNGREMKQMGIIGLHTDNDKNPCLYLDKDGLEDSDLLYMDDTTPMQYTNLKDKNGVEIYEGDIVEIEGGREEALADKVWSNQYRAVVEYSRGKFELDRTIRGSGYGGHDVAFLVEHLEVIGNIHENPELLEKSS